MATVDGMLEAAAQRTGLDDFGDDSYREGLGVLLSSLRDEARLNARGEQFLHSRIGAYLDQRLQVEDWCRRHPEIGEVPVTAPLIGLGLPRTGSTALSILLAKDPGVRYLRRWESSPPCPPPSTVHGADPRIPAGKGEMVGSRFHVPVDVHGPMECHDLMALDFKSHMFLSFARIPTYAAWLVESADLTSTYHYQRRVMKLLLTDASTRLKTSVEGGLMGGPRYEQLFRATGSVTVDGGEPHRFTGSGLRIRRQGVRKLAGFWGHCWQSAVFPGGRAFGYIAYPPRPDGQPTFNEGFIFDGDGDLIPARVIQAPWLTRLQAVGEDVSLVLETARGTVAIEGETVLSTHDVHHNDDMYSMKALRKEMASFPALQQAGVRYRWDGEEAFGMLERSSPLDKIAR
jgi:hypothetical protein